MYGNVYGAVPRALEGTRQTLREIMSDIAATKSQESKLKLALGELELEKKGLELEGEKERFRTGIDLAKLGMEKGFQESRLGLERESLAEQTRHARALETGEKERIGIERDKAAVLQQEAARLGETKPVEEWAQELGLTPSQQEIWRSYFPEGTTLSRRDVEEQAADIRKNPGIHYKHRLVGDVDRLEALGTQLEDPNLAPADRAALEKQYDDLWRRTKQLDTLVSYIDAGKTKLTPKEFEQIEEGALMNWEMSEEIQARYGGDYERYKKDYKDDYLKTLNQGVLNMEALRRTKEPKTGKALSTEDKQALMDAVNEIHSTHGKSAADTAMNQIRLFVQQGDLDKARQYLEDFKKAPETSAAQKKPSSPENEKPSTAKAEEKTIDTTKQFGRAIPMSEGGKLLLKEETMSVKAANPDLSDEEATNIAYANISSRGKRLDLLETDEAKKIIAGMKEGYSSLKDFVEEKGASSARYRQERIERLKRKSTEGMSLPRLFAAGTR
jgi:hypothetical protein